MTKGEPGIVKHTYSLDGGGEYVYYVVNHNIVLRMFIDKAVVILSPFWSEPLTLPASTDLVEVLDRLMSGIGKVLGAPKVAVPKTDLTTADFALKLIGMNPYGLTQDDISFVMRENGYSSSGLDWFLRSSVEKGRIHVTSDGRYVA